MKKNSSDNGIAIRFAKKLVNRNALSYCARNFLPCWKNGTYFYKKTAAKFVNATA